MRFIGNDPKTPRQTQVVASGTLSTGDTVVVNSDGTVSAVTGSSGSESVGTEVTYNAANSQSATAAYDVASGNIVVAFQDYGVSGKGRAVVGSISGSSISFGTEVEFESGSTFDTSAVYDSANQKIVIVYKDNGNTNRPTAVVGTVSGTSITFGTPVVISSNQMNTVAGAAYDASTGKIVVAYSDYSNGYYGTAVVGTVSGTSISFGTPVVFNSAVTSPSTDSLAYDAAAERVIIPYKDNGNSNRGTAVVATVSGTSVSFGTPVVFEYTSIEGDGIQAVYDSTNQKIAIVYHFSATGALYAIAGTVSGSSITFGTAVSAGSHTAQWTSASYDSLAQKVIINFNDNANSSHGTVLPFSISGTTVTFDTATVYNTATSRYMASAYDSVNQKTALVFTDWGTDYYGKVVVYGSAYNTTNITSENFIGTAQTGAADGNRAVVNIKGAIDENQSGLTAGQSYYVQTDGSLGTTAADPSVFAGTAVSATKLIVKG